MIMTAYLWILVFKSSEPEKPAVWDGVYENNGRYAPRTVLMLMQNSHLYVAVTVTEYPVHPLSARTAPRPEHPVSG